LIGNLLLECFLAGDGFAIEDGLDAAFGKRYAFQRGVATGLELSEQFR
jgi:hypothetical protein